MNNKRFAKLAKRIIKQNIYLSLGTYSPESGSWVSPVCYFLDKKYNFYYASQLTSVHTKNIIKNSTISFAIFDSHMEEGTGVGVQIAGKAALVKDSELREVLKVYKSKFVSPELFQGEAAYRLFRLTPQQVFVTDPEAKVDRRVKVNLSDLQKN